MAFTIVNAIATLQKPGPRPFGAMIWGFDMLNSV